jgi:hypothetical protein
LSVRVVEIDTKRRTGLVGGAIKSEHTLSIGRDDCPYECFILAFPGEVVCDRGKLVQILDFTRWRRNIRREAISEVSRRHIT